MPLPLTAVGAGGGGAKAAPGGTPLVVAVGGLEAGKTRSVIFSLCLCSDLSTQNRYLDIERDRERDE